MEYDFSGKIKNKYNILATVNTTNIWWGAMMAQRLERRTLNRENPGSNPLAADSKLWQFRSSHVATAHSAI